MINIIIARQRIQKKLVLKAIKKGIWEDFGQTEVMKLKDKYGYNDYGVERKITEEIDFFDNWCMGFDDNKLREWNLVLGIEKIMDKNVKISI